jgi:drug/metabolite transporter (DMT)-like permease
LHIAVVLLAGTAILGDLISQSASVLVWWRTIIAGLGMLIFFTLTGKLNINWIRTKKKVYGLGGLIAIHWLCFFGSVKLANASTALICFSTISFFTAFIEPMITGRKRKNNELIFGLMVIPGIALIAGKAEGELLFGIILGLIAAFLTAIFASLEKKWITEIDPYHLTFMQMVGAFGTISIWLIFENQFFPIESLWPNTQDLIYLLVLGLVCTCVAWVLAARAIRSITAFDSNMVINLEPVYGIVMALFLLGDGKELTTTFYIGAGIILCSVILHSIWQSRYVRH